tara:strand:- start:2187 stop:3149 length:963 start_codon:yes stop_codon:yes gene_type:complete
MAKSPVGYRSPFNKISSVKPSPVKWVNLALAAAPGVISAVGSLAGRKKRLQEQQAAKAEMEQAKSAWESIEYKNPYANLQNPYAENVYEDMTVDTQAADYLKQQQQQSQANIMQNLKGVAGSSGVAGLAQSLANISAGQAQKAAANIATQERSNQMARLKGEQLKQQGQSEIDLLKAKGEHWKRKQDQERTTSMYGLSIDRMAAADKARQTAREGVVKGIGQAVAGVAGVYGAGGDRSGMLGKDLKGLGSKISGMFGGGGGSTAGTGFNFDIPKFGENAFGKTEGGIGAYGLGGNLDLSSFTPSEPKFRFDPVTRTYRIF